MKLQELLPTEPPAVEPVPDIDTKSWMRDIDQRVRRVEKLCWTLMGALPVLTFVRACI